MILRTIIILVTSVFTPFVVDRITKEIILHYQPKNYAFTSFLSFDLCFNRGIAWSWFHSQSALVFSLVTLIIGCFIIFLAWHALQRFKAGFYVGPELLVMTGALSNFFDRFLYGGVVDFIVLHYGSWYWPTFNVADYCIVLGVILMVVQEIYETKYT